MPQTNSDQSKIQPNGKPWGSTQQAVQQAGHRARITGRSHAAVWTPAPQYWKSQKRPEKLDKPSNTLTEATEWTQSRWALSLTGLLRKEGQMVPTNTLPKHWLLWIHFRKHTELNATRNQVLYLIWSKSLAKQCSGSEVRRYGNPKLSWVLQRWKQRPSNVVTPSQPGGRGPETHTVEKATESHALLREAGMLTATQFSQVHSDLRGTITRSKVITLCLRLENQIQYKSFVSKSVWSEYFTEGAGSCFSYYLLQPITQAIWLSGHVTWQPTQSLIRPDLPAMTCNRRKWHIPCGDAVLLSQVPFFTKQIHM